MSWLGNFWTEVKKGVGIGADQLEHGAEGIGVRGAGVENITSILSAIGGGLSGVTSLAAMIAGIAHFIGFKSFANNILNGAEELAARSSLVDENATAYKNQYDQDTEAGPGVGPNSELTAPDNVALSTGVGLAAGGLTGAFAGATLGAVKGAALGATLGSVIPVVGTAIGGAIGGTLGGGVGLVSGGVAGGAIGGGTGWGLSKLYNWFAGGETEPPSAGSTPIPASLPAPNLAGQ